MTDEDRLARSFESTSAKNPDLFANPTLQGTVTIDVAAKIKKNPVCPHLFGAVRTFALYLHLLLVDFPNKVSLLRVDSEEESVVVLLFRTTLSVYSSAVSSSSP